MHSARWLVGCLAFLVWTAALSGAAVAVEDPPWAAETEAALERIVAGHNAAVGDVTLGPEVAPLRGERVVLTVADTDGSAAQFSFETDDGLRVVDFRAGSHADATVLMFTDRATVTRIADAPDRGAAFETAVRAGEIRIEGVGVQGLLWSLLGVVLWALRSPLQAAAVGGIVVFGLGGALFVGAKVVAGGVAAGGTGAVASATSSTTATAGTTGPSTATAGAASPTTPAANAPMGADVGGNTVTATSAIDPVSVADETLSFFERLLFIVAIVKKLGARLRHRVERLFSPLTRRLGVGRLSDAQSERFSDVDSPTARPPTAPARRRAGPRRRRPRRR